MVPIARACACDTYFTVDPTGELCLKPGTMGLRQTLYYGTGSHTFVKANYPWLSRIEVEVQAGGGGSAGANAAANEAIPRPGGAGGGYSKSLLAVSALGASVPITVGAGGTAGGATTEGGDGRPSSFGSLVIATGGSGGTNNMPSGTSLNTGQGIAGPGAGTGSFAVGGGASGSAIRLSGGYAMAGHGGDSFLGTGGLGRTTEGAGLTSRGYGAGAGGGLSFGGSVTGGVGGAGRVIVHLYG
ncbi:glycine-rich domain-containing protein [[Kitasatospora] papulosa]|uniref:glycine-rich domain-containing protein n=1 Tax=[Kitasatospora] papulosa TaxID=1464011 RepID=UPI003673724A